MLEITQEEHVIENEFIKQNDQTVSNNDLNNIAEELFKVSQNDLSQYVKINLQGQVSENRDEDHATQPLLHVAPVIWNYPSIMALKTLYDNYEQNTDYEESVSSEENREELQFLDIIIKSPVISSLMDFLHKKELVSNDKNLQKNLIKTIWFDLYSRNKRSESSSGFEHVFLSEIKKNKIIGLHNWIYFHYEELNGNINYLGYMKKIDLPNGISIVKLRFSINNLVKPVSAMFVGSSPELEIALFTLCFIARTNKSCKLKVGEQKFSIVNHSLDYNGKKLIGTVYPSI